MFCRRCKKKMVEQGRSYHKSKKWICPYCGAVRFERVKKNDGKKP